MKPIRTVLLGLGMMGKNHLRVLTSQSQFQLVGVFDPQVKHLPEHPQVPVVSALEELLTLDFECAVVATPTQTHFELVQWLLKHNKHVLVEKPSASTYEEAKILEQLARERQRVLVVGNIERCNPVVSKLREVLATQVIGRPIHVDATRAGRFPNEVKPGNNVILDLAVHELDVLMLCFGALEITRSFVHATALAGIYDTAEIVARTALGMTASVHVNWFTPQRLRYLRVTGTKGVLEINYIDQTCVVYGYELGQYPQFDQAVYKKTQFCEQIEMPVVKQESLRIQLAQFYQALKGQSHFLCTGQELVQSVYLAEQCILKAEQGLHPELASL